VFIRTKEGVCVKAKPWRKQIGWKCEAGVKSVKKMEGSGDTGGSADVKRDYRHKLGF